VTLTPGLRKFALTAHVVASVGWAGAVAAFLALAIVGFFGADAPLLRASYVAMDLVYRMVVVPLGLASLVTGVVSSLGTEWGLVRHYWVVLKLFLTVPAVVLMLLHLDPVQHAAHAASSTALASVDLGGIRSQLLLYAGAALALLLTVTVLSTYKPRGRTRHGARQLAKRSM
jgi:hypothetical protein